MLFIPKAIESSGAGGRGDASSRAVDAIDAYWRLATEDGSFTQSFSSTWSDAPVIAVTRHWLRGLPRNIYTLSNAIFSITAFYNLLIIICRAGKILPSRSTSELKTLSAN